MYEIGNKTGEKSYPESVNKAPHGRMYFLPLQGCTDVVGVRYGASVIWQPPLTGEGTHRLWTLQKWGLKRPPISHILTWSHNPLKMYIVMPHGMRSVLALEGGKPEHVWSYISGSTLKGHMYLHLEAGTSGDAQRCILTRSSGSDTTAVIF